MAAQTSSQLPADEKVKQLVDLYNGDETYHPFLLELFTSNAAEDKYWNCLNHDFDLFRNRSGNLADHEISIMQKAFMKLCQHDTADYVPRANFYLLEILGLGTDASGEMERAIESRLETFKGSYNFMHTHVDLLLISYCCQSLKASRKKATGLDPIQVSRLSF